MPADYPIRSNWIVSRLAGYTRTHTYTLIRVCTRARTSAKGYTCAHMHKQASSQTWHWRRAPRNRVSILSRAYQLKKGALLNWHSFLSHSFVRSFVRSFFLSLSLSLSPSILRPFAPDQIAAHCAPELGRNLHGLDSPY